MKFWPIFIVVVCVLVGVQLVQHYKPELYHDERFVAAFLALIPLSFLGFAFSDIRKGSFNLGGRPISKTSNPMFFYGFIAAVCLFSAFVLIGMLRKFSP